MNLSDAMGWLAAALMLLTFSCAGPRSLRAFALAANVAFIGYGLVGHLPPVVTLHAMLLPINAFRLAGSIRAAIRRDRAAASARVGVCAAPRAAYSPPAKS